MATDFPERDWKIFRKIHTAALDHFCQRVLSEITRIANDTSTSNHERYRCIFQLIRERDADIADAFNDFRRSTALRQLAIMHSLNILSEDEMEGFSADTQASVKAMSEIFSLNKDSASK